MIIRTLVPNRSLTNDDIFECNFLRFWQTYSPEIFAAGPIFILQSGAQPTEHTQQVSHCIWYSTVLLGSIRHGLLQEIRPQKVCNSIAQPKELSIQKPYQFSFNFSQQDCVIKFMRYSLLLEIRPQTLDIGLRASQQDWGQLMRSGLFREICSGGYQGSIQAPIG